MLFRREHCEPRRPRRHARALARHRYSTAADAPGGAEIGTGQLFRRAAPAAAELEAVTAAATDGADDEAVAAEDDNGAAAASLLLTLPRGATGPTRSAGRHDQHVWRRATARGRRRLAPAQFAPAALAPCDVAWPRGRRT